MTSKKCARCAGAINSAIREKYTSVAAFDTNSANTIACGGHTCACVCACVHERLTFVFIDEVFDVCVCDCWGYGGCYFILFVQLYELLLLLCSLMADMYFNVFVLIHFAMCLEQTCWCMGRRKANKLYNNNNNNDNNNNNNNRGSPKCLELCGWVKDHTVPKGLYCTDPLIS